MKIHIIAEGPTDREILKCLLILLIDTEILEIRESKSQQKNRGVRSILLEYNKLEKFLHHGYSQMADVILICVDNDNDDKNIQGISITRKNILEQHVSRFIGENLQYSYLDPKFVYVVPVETLDYWMKCVKSREFDCQIIRQIENISKNDIKELTYGVDNVHYGWIISYEAIETVKREIEQKGVSLSKLRCLGSFQDFESQLRVL